MSMAATTAGAFKAHIESLGLGLPVYRDGLPVIRWETRDGQRTPVHASPPAIVVQDGISITGDLSGDFGDDEHGDPTSIELVQIDVFQVARVQTTTQTTRNAEDPALIRRLRLALRGVGIAPYAPVRVYGHRVTDEQRWPISDNVARHTFNVTVRLADRPLPTPTP